MSYPLRLITKGINKYLNIFGRFYWLDRQTESYPLIHINISIIFVLGLMARPTTPVLDGIGQGITMVSFLFFTSP